jgi:hypothetical protein
MQWTGTFARVWLTRLKNCEQKDKVFALKILRKADGTESFPFSRCIGAEEVD